MGHQTKPAELVLINVPYGTGDAQQSMQPLGLSYLGAFLKQRGVSARGIDLGRSTQSPEDIAERLPISDCPAVGLSFYNENARSAYRLAKAIKAKNPRCTLVCGGAHPTAADPKLLFERHPEVDIVIRNEGEETLFEVMKALGSASPVAGILGTSHKSDGAIIVESDRDRIGNLDELPAPIFDFEGCERAEPLFYFDRETRTRKPAVALVSSRSCPYSCSFCAIILIGRQWRKASPQKVVSDLRELEAHSGGSYGHVYFMDANFFVDAKRSLAIAEELHKYRPDITFSFSTRVNQLIKGRPLLGELKRLGLRAVELGIESGSQHALNRFAKDTTIAQNDEALRLLRSHGLQLFLDFIMFDAEAGLDDLDANLTWMERNGLDNFVPWDHVFSYMTPYLGTEIRRHYERLLDSSFDEDGLPDPARLFRNDQVRCVFEELRKLQIAIPEIAAALFQAEEQVRRFTEWGREQARATLNAVTLRRLPFVVVRDLVVQAKSGGPISYDSALPRFSDDAGKLYSIDYFLNCASAES